MEMDKLTQDLISAVRSLNVDKVKELVEKGANVQENCLLFELIKAISTQDLTKDGSGWDLGPEEDFGLLESTWRPNAIKILDILVQKGADVNVQNAKGYTPLHLSGECRGDPNFAEALLLRGGDLSIKSVSGAKPMDLWTHPSTMLVGYSFNSEIDLTNEKAYLQAIKALGFHKPFDFRNNVKLAGLLNLFYAIHNSSLADREELLEKVQNSVSNLIPSKILDDFRISDDLEVLHRGIVEAENLQKATQKSYEILKTDYPDLYSKMQKQNLFNLEEQIQLLRNKQEEFFDLAVGSFVDHTFKTFGAQEKDRFNLQRELQKLLELPGKKVFKEVYDLNKRKAEEEKWTERIETDIAPKPPSQRGRT